MKEFSKRLLVLDYIVTIVLISIFIICVLVNGVYSIYITNELVRNGMELYTVNSPIPLDVFGVVIGTWVAQLGISSGAYYLMAKSDHRIQLPMRLFNEMPNELKKQCDMTQIITTVLSTGDN